MATSEYGSRYEVTERIGAGGMADVYKGLDRTLGRTVAIKVLQARLAADPTFAARFRQEAQSAAGLASPNIVNVYDWGKTGDTYFIVMEFVDGTDLKTLIERSGPPSPRQVADIGAQVCSALSVAHAAQVIHRDIKPHNIMVQPDGIVKVMDFGIARAGNTTMTQTGSVLGTAHYVSPEQAQGRPLGPASDLYSLGVVLYEAATGKMPFDADTPVAVALKQVNEQPVPPRQLNPAIPPALETIILKAMAKRPEDRYVSADAMRTDLLAVSAGQPIATTIPPEPTPAQQTAVMAPVAGAAAARATRSTPPRRRTPWWVWALIILALLGLGLGVAYAMGAFGPKTVDVPDIVGKTPQEATQLLQQAGLVVGKRSSAFNENVKAGLIISQDPKSGTAVEPGSAVGYVVSQGIEQVEVPKVVGKTDTQAAQILQDAGFILALPRNEYSNKPEGTVLAQDPEGGTSAAKGSTVTLTVSRGPQLIEVPNVEGKSRSQATSILKDAGFEVRVNEEFSDTVAKGVVISQNPASGLPAYKGSTISITVSKGENVVTVPNVVGKSEKAAVDQLEKIGLVVQVSFQDSTQNDKVLSQDPPAGARIPPGSEISIVVGRTPTPPAPTTP